MHVNHINLHSFSRAFIIFCICKLVNASVTVVGLTMKF